MRAIGTADWITAIAVSAAARTLGNAQTAAAMAGGWEQRNGKQ